MQIEQPETCGPFPIKTTTSNIATSRYYHPAADHAAAFPTRLALARWTRGGDVPHVFSSTRNLPARAVWYAQAERQFQAWLENGGFHAE